MNLSLTTQLEKLIDAKVKTGRYSTASEVVREGLRLLEERDEERNLLLKRLRGEIKVGLDQIEQRQVGSLHIKRIKTEGRKRLASKSKHNHLG